MSSFAAPSYFGREAIKQFPVQRLVLKLAGNAECIFVRQTIVGVTNRPAPDGRWNIPGRGYERVNSANRDETIRP